MGKKSSSRSTLVRIDSSLNGLLKSRYIGKDGVNSVNDAVWYLLNHEQDIEEVERRNPEVKKLELEVAKERNARYAEKEYEAAKVAGKKKVTVDLE